MKYVIAAIAYIVGIALALGAYALVAWGVAILVSYLFGITFGFWKAVAAMLLISIFGSLLFGRFAKGGD